MTMFYGSPSEFAWENDEGQWVKDGFGEVKKNVTLNGLGRGQALTPPKPFNVTFVSTT